MSNGILLGVDDTGIDAVQVADEREFAAGRAANCEYELRLAREDIKSLQEKLSRQSEVIAALPRPRACLVLPLIELNAYVGITKSWLTMCGE